VYEPELPPQRESIIDALADLLQMASDWVRHEAETTVREKIALPLQNVGIAVGSVAAAGCLAVFGLISIAIALFMVLGRLITYPGAFGLIGAVYLIGAIVFIVISQRKKLKDAIDSQTKPKPEDR
jgi:hypothetical protein